MKVHSRRWRTGIIAALAVLLLSLGVFYTQSALAVSAPTATCDASTLGCAADKAGLATIQLSNLALPNLQAPTPPAPASKPVTRTVTYSTATRGNITSDFAEFKTDANETLNDARGWSRLGVKFQEVASGGQFTIVLTEAGLMTSFSDQCDAQWSCTVGNDVIINQDRWANASASWNAAGGTMRDYRHMVINHETGHWLGHGHLSCPAAGSPAPVMQQQSIDLQGCKFNPWPLDSELWSTKLGIS